MQITEQTNPYFSTGTQSARSLVRTFSSDGMTLEPEKTEEELQLESSTFSYQRQLTPEEENRVLYLQNLLAQTLAMADGQPTEEQRARIREIEKELEKITGVKTRSSLSNATRNMPKTKKDEDEDEEDKLDIDGIDPQEAVHNSQTESGESTNLGMQMLKQNALCQQLSSALEKSGTLGLFSEVAS